MRIQFVKTAGEFKTGTGDILSPRNDLLAVTPARSRGYKKGFETSSRWLTLSMIVLLGGTAGCYQRNVAPELTYEQKQVDVLNDEIEKFEW